MSSAADYHWVSAKRKTPWLVYLGILVVVLIVPLVFGLSIEVTPIFIPVAFLLFLALIGGILFKSELVFFISLFGVLFIPQYKVQDVILLLTLLFVAYKHFQQPAAHENYTWPVWLKALIGVALIAPTSALIGLAAGDNEPKAIYDELRSFGYILYLPILLTIFPKMTSRSLGNVILLSSLVISLIVIPQGILGRAILGTGRVGALDTTGVASIEASVTRVQISGIMIICSAFILSASRYFLARSWDAVAYAGLMLIFSLALYYNFGRAVWFWMIMAFSAVALMSGKRAVIQFLLVAASLLSAYIVVKEVWNPASLTVLENRVYSVGSEGGYGTSYGWREIENREAFKTLAATFGAGVGVGGEYRPFYIPLRVFPLHVRYIHQGYLYITLKLSVLGLLLYVAVLLGGATAAFKLWAKSAKSNPDFLGMGVTICAYMALNMTQPILMSYDGILALALVLAMLYRAQSDAGVSWKEGTHGSS